jgi:hypothetical protein
MLNHRRYRAHNSNTYCFRESELPTAAEFVVAKGPLTQAEPRHQYRGPGQADFRDGWRVTAACVASLGPDGLGRCRGVEVWTTQSQRWERSDTRRHELRTGELGNRAQRSPSSRRIPHGSLLILSMRTICMRVVAGRSCRWWSFRGRMWSLGGGKVAVLPCCMPPGRLTSQCQLGRQRPVHA